MCGLIYLARRSGCETAHYNAAACTEQYKRKYTFLEVLSIYRFKLEVIENNMLRKIFEEK
jgi:hypothetical protein